MDLGLKGKVAFVGGASSGLGEAVARGLAAEGANLILCARHEDKLRAVAAEIIAERGTDVYCLSADLGDPDAVSRAIRTSLNHVERVDILFSNTGGPPAGSFETLASGMWDAAYRQLLQSAVELARGFLPGMRAQGWGRIIHSTSVAVKQPIDGLMLSNSLRAAVVGFSRTLANEVAKDGVTVNCVMPGFIRTARLDYLAERNAEASGGDRAAAEKKWTDTIPIGRIGTVSEFADVVVFLASRKSAYVTGQSIAIDGGVVKSLY